MVAGSSPAGRTNFRRVHSGDIGNSFNQTIVSSWTTKTPPSLRPAAKATQQHVESLNGRLELHRLPTYAPDLNPDEFVWSHMKTNGVSKKPLKQNESLRDRVEEDLLKIKADPALVCSFFYAPSVAYTND